MSTKAMSQEAINSAEKIVRILSDEQKDAVIAILL